ncbi:MAG: hypothetical protein GXP27_15280 [Planctomycetes bacterium]|nr:hypothetical protein [Planctomycetota bacterium]
MHLKLIPLVSSLLAACALGWAAEPTRGQSDASRPDYGRSLPVVRSLGIGPCMAAQVVGERLYVIGRGRLYVADVSEPAQPKLLGTLEGLGNTRQITVQDDIAYITSREHGVFIVDVRDPANPELLSRYDSIEVATGVAVCGPVLFVACRLHGVELVDVGDPRRPRHLSTVRTGEAQSVAVRDGFAYVGVWGTSELVVADVRNARQPLVVARMPLDGYGDGVALAGRYAFVATGHHCRTKPNRKPGDPGYGRGHGLEIFDISDPARPRFVSRVKFPPFYRIGNDMWSVKVAGRYAFVADTHNGLFVVDVTEPEKPRVIGHCRLPKPVGSNLPGFVGGLALGDGVVYVAGGDTDLHVVAAPGMAQPVRRPSCGRSPVIRAASSVESESARVYRCDGQLYAVAVLPKAADTDALSDVAVLAAGADGLHLVRLGGKLTLLRRYATRGWARDVAVCGRLAFVAEDTGGLSIWKWHGDPDPRLEPIGGYEAEGRPIRQVAVPRPGRHALVQVGMSTLDIVDVRDPRRPTRVLRDRGHGFLYDLCKNYAAAERSNGRPTPPLFPVVWQLGGVRWYDLAADPPRFSGREYPHRVGDAGTVVLGKRTLLTYRGGYLLLEPGEQRPPAELPLCAPDRRWRRAAKPTLAGDRLYLSDRRSGEISALDISQLDRPRLLGRMPLRGNPGRLVVTQHGLLVPNGYEGLRLIALRSDGRWTDEETPAARFAAQVERLCQQYVRSFGSETTHLVYHHRLDGPRGVAALASPGEIAARTVGGRPMPYGYGSGIQDVALEGGQFLFALCDAYEATGREEFARMARWLFEGFKRIATVSPEPGFVPRGPHPDGRSYYPDSSRDQHAAFIEALWRYGRSPLATDEDRRFIAKELNEVGRRLERYDWKIMVEHGSKMAHVGFGWRQYTSIGAVSLLSALAMIADATGDEHWWQLYERYSSEKDGIRWRRFLHPDAVATWKPLTLYSNQFAQAVAALERIERSRGEGAESGGRRAEKSQERKAASNEHGAGSVERHGRGSGRADQLRELLRRLALRSLDSNVFDPQLWRRLDWAGHWTEAEIEDRLAKLGLSLQPPMTVIDLYRWFDPAHWRNPDPDVRRISAKLCFGLPTVAFHTALLSRDRQLIERIRPHVEDMIQVMLAHGRYYDRGENFNRAVVLGLQLLAPRKQELP